MNTGTRSRPIAALTALCLLLGSACRGQPDEPGATADRGVAAATESPGDSTMPDPTPEDATPKPTLESATLGAGCFWCVEAVLEQLDGVSDVRSGYMGGHVANPTYEQICTGRSGHAEVVQVDFDPGVISYAKILEWFWKLHDPTTLNQQGNDVGPQYRSAIFYHSDDQKKIAEASLQAADDSGAFPLPIVTEITAASTFYVADEYHQDYYRANKQQGYCRYVITPKLDKLGLEK